MAGHSQFKNIMHRKGAQDARRARLFTKLGREIMVAARIGLPDPASNPRLRAAMAAARQVNMPKDNIERLIKRAIGEEGATDYAEIRYEGYGPGGVALIVEALTDNRNRTAAEVRSVFTKHGGSLGETNSVSFMFDRVGEIAYDPVAGSPDAVFEAALEAGAENVESAPDGHVVTTAVDALNAVSEGLEQSLGEPRSAALVWRPNVTVKLDEERAAALMKLIDALEENDDVQRVSSNEDVPQEVMERLAAA